MIKLIKVLLHVLPTLMIATAVWVALTLIVGGFYVAPTVSDPNRSMPVWQGMLAVAPYTGLAVGIALFVVSAVLIGDNRKRWLIALTEYEAELTSKREAALVEGRERERELSDIVRKEIDPYIERRKH
jgi:hypothetical protein